MRHPDEFECGRCEERKTAGRWMETPRGYAKICVDCIGEAMTAKYGHPEAER